MKSRSLLFCFASLFVFSQSQAQYCAPVVTTGGVYFSSIKFIVSGVTGGVNHTTGSSGYTNGSGSSSGNMQRSCFMSIPFTVLNPGASSASISVRIFADWNGDNDFDDADEITANNVFTIAAGGSTVSNLNFYPAAHAVSPVRLRFAVRQGGASAVACGGFTGEIEDYSVTFSANTAPVMNGSATPFFNPMIESQTSNDGFKLEQLFYSVSPGAALETDADACAQSGIAITGTTGSNGQWEYRIGNGAWTGFGAVSLSNALLLTNASLYIPETRLRFIPSGAGTSGFDFHAWDGNSGSHGQHANISSTGGSTAFSTGSKSISIVTYSTASAASDVKMYIGTTTVDYAGNYDIVSSSLNRSTGILKFTENVTGNNSDGFAYDVAIDNTNNKLVWTGGNDNVSIIRSNFDGSGMENLLAATFYFPTGIATSSNRIFISDFSNAILSCALDGSDIAYLTGGAGQANDISETADIEYANNKIYYINSPSGVNFNIMQANTDGTGSVQFYTSTNILHGLAVTASTVYWTEMNTSNAASVKSKLLSGGSVTDLVTEAGQFYNDISVDESHSKIYIVALSNPGKALGRIKSIPLAGGSTTRLLDLENNVSSFAFSQALVTLPVHFVNIKAVQQDNTIQVQWNIANEENLQKYIVQRSADGSQFTDAGAVTASNKNSYDWPDAQPLNGNNYYRIKAVDIDGSVQYSKIVMVSRGKNKPAVTVYPTIVRGGQFNLKLENMVAASYQLTAINSSGQQVYAKTIVHTGGSSVQSISLPGIPNGVYRLKISGQGENWVETIVIK